MGQKLTYKDAGVDISAGDALVRAIKQRVRKTHGPAVLGGVGGFAALFSLKEALGTLKDPLLVSGTDGVGTKLKLAFATDRHDTIGTDLVAMCVNDIITTGALPLFFLDYFGTGRLQPQTAEAVIGGIAAGCETARCALVGGETAELPGMYADGEYDLAGFAVGAVERDAVVDGPQRAQSGDVLIGIRSHGLHSNGYSLARAALLDRAALDLDAHPDVLDRPLGETLLTPTAIYVDVVQGLDLAQVHGLCHITGGGITENLPRILRPGLAAKIDSRSIRTQPIFDLIAECGNVDPAEMRRTFNMGVGMVVITAPENADAMLKAIHDKGEEANIIGALEATPDTEAPRVIWDD